MVTEDYVSFDIAVLLKEAGFNESVNHVYSDKKELLQLKDYAIRDLTNSECNNYKNWQFPIETVNSIISAPTLQMVMKWLREIQGLNIYARAVWKDVEVQYDYWKSTVVGYDWLIESLIDDTYSRMSTEPFLTYEEACEVAIKYCLTNLI